MTRHEGSPRGDLHLLEPTPKLGEARLDSLLGDSRGGFQRIHYMLMLLTATEIELQDDQWGEFCLPQRSGPVSTLGSDAVRRKRTDFDRLCRAANLTLSARSWRVQGDVTVDTRELVRLVRGLDDAVRSKRLTNSVELINQLELCAPRLQEPDLPATWPLARLFATVGGSVPRGLKPELRDDFLQHAMEVTGLDRLQAAIRSAKTELPRRVFEALLEEKRFQEAKRILDWIAPSYARSYDLRRKLHGRMPDLATEPTWVGIGGGPAETVVAIPATSGAIGETSVPVGLGGAMNGHDLAQSARRVMDELSSGAGRAVKSIVVGCAGFDPESPRDLLHALAEATAHHHLRSSLWVANDGDLLLFAPPVLGSGVAVVADMGSVVVGRVEDCRAVRRGGDEWLMSDVGSGYAVAVHTLSEVYDISDRCGLGDWPSSDVVDLVTAARHAFWVPSPHDEQPGDWCRRVMKYIARDRARAWDKSLIAGFARDVLKLAEAGNKIAERIVIGSAEQLGVHMADVLAWHPDSSPRIVITGFMVTSDLYFDALARRAGEHLKKLGLPGDRVQAKLAGLLVPATDGAADARVENAAVLFAHLARMLDARVSDLHPDESAVVKVLRDSRSRSIVEHIPRVRA